MTPPPPHFGWPKMNFDRISRHFRSIRNFHCFWFRSQNGCRRPFWITEKITFNRISRHFRSIRNFDFFYFFHKMAAGGHFEWPKITFDRISRHFRSIRNFDFFFKFTKWLPAAILDDRKSLSNAFLAISNQYTINFLKLLYIYIYTKQFLYSGHLRDWDPVVVIEEWSQ